MGHGPGRNDHRLRVRLCFAEVPASPRSRRQSVSDAFSALNGKPDGPCGGNHRTGFGTSGGKRINTCEKKGREARRGN